MTDANLQFIREKIYSVRTALMYSLSEEQIRLPNSVVQAEKVDDSGDLWFECQRPSVFPGHYSEAFPARLVFYRKGSSFHLEVSGKAYVDNQEEHYGPLRIRMHITNASYTLSRSHNRKSGIQDLFRRMGQWIGRQRQRRVIVAGLQPIEQS